jgi:hypothetical protein
MEKLSLDDEPPPRFRGEKEVSRRKNKNLPQLIFSTRNEKNKEKSIENIKNIEKKVKTNIQEYQHDANYSSLERYFSEDNNQSSTLKNLEFTRPTTTGPNSISQNFNYFQGKESTMSIENRIQNFYGISSSYSFTAFRGEQTSTRQEYSRKKEEYSESKEHLEKEEKEEKEIIYTLHEFEEGKTAEETNIKLILPVQN